MYDRAAVGVYPSHTDAEEAVRRLEGAGIPLQEISIIGRDLKAQEAKLGRYLPPDYVEEGLEHQSEREGIWIGGLFGLMVGFGSFLVPAIGILVVLGPLAGLLGGMAVGAVVGEITGQTSFYDLAAEYRDSLQAGHFLVLVHCTTDEEMRIRQVIESTQPIMVKSQPMVLRTSL